jgi:hypothetical protein
VRPRLQAAAANLDRTILTDWHIEIPDVLASFATSSA